MYIVLTNTFLIFSTYNLTALFFLKSKRSPLLLFKKLTLLSTTALFFLSIPSLNESLKILLISSAVLFNLCLKNKNTFFILFNLSSFLVFLFADLNLVSFFLLIELFNFFTFYFLFYSKSFFNKNFNKVFFSFVSSNLITLFSLASFSYFFLFSFKSLFFGDFNYFLLFENFFFIKTLLFFYIVLKLGFLTGTFFNLEIYKNINLDFLLTYSFMYYIILVLYFFNLIPLVSVNLFLCSNVILFLVCLNFFYLKRKLSDRLFFFISNQNNIIYFLILLIVSSLSVMFNSGNLQTTTVVYFFNCVAFFSFLTFISFFKKKTKNSIFSKKKRSYLFSTFIWFLCFLPVSIGFFFKLFMFIFFNKKIFYFIMIFFSLYNTISLSAYFYFNKLLERFFFKNESRGNIYLFYNTLYFLLFSNFIFFLL